MFFVDRCLSFCPFSFVLSVLLLFTPLSFDHYVVCSSFIYSFIIWLLCCLFFFYLLLLLLTIVVSVLLLFTPFTFDYCVVCSSFIYSFFFWLLCCLFFFYLLLFLLTIVLSVLLLFTIYFCPLGIFKLFFIHLSWSSRKCYISETEGRYSIRYVFLIYFCYTNIVRGCEWYMM